MVLSENINKVFLVQKNPDLKTIIFVSNIDDINNVLLFKRITNEDYNQLLDTNEYISEELIIYCEPLNDNDLIKLNDN